MKKGRRNKMRRKFLIIEAYGNTYLFKKEKISMINKIGLEIMILTADSDKHIFGFDTISEVESCFNSIKKQIK